MKTPDLHFHYLPVCVTTNHGRPTLLEAGRGDGKRFDPIKKTWDDAPGTERTAVTDAARHAIELVEELRDLFDEPSEISPPKLIELIDQRLKTIYGGTI